MSGASISNKDCSLHNTVTWTAKRRALIDGVLVVEAAAGRIQLDELITHDTGLNPKVVRGKKPGQYSRRLVRLCRISGGVCVRIEGNGFVGCVMVLAVVLMAS